MKEIKTKKYIVTTNIEKTWFNDEKIFFLGKWCRDYKNETKIINLNHEFHNHHWENDNEILNKDCKYIRDLNVRLLDYICNNLVINQNLKLKKEFWETALSIWLSSFTTMLYDKWKILQSFLKQNERYFTKIIKYEENHFIPNNLENYFRLRHTDIYNHYLFSEILIYHKLHNNYDLDFEIVKFDYLNQISQKHFKQSNILLNNLKLRTFKFFNFFYSFTHKNNYFCVIDKYLNKIENFKLNFSLGQFPILFLYKDLGIKENVIKSNRKNLFVNDFNFKNDFEKFLNNFLSKNIPYSFVEELTDYINNIEKSNLPKNPKSIFAPNIINNTFLTIYCALKKNNASKLIYAQHGGSYGQHLINSYEYIERKCSDKFLTWGWDDKNDKRIFKFGRIKSSKQNVVNYKNNKKILLVHRMQKKYITEIDSLSSSLYTKEYFSGHESFLNTVNSNLRKNIIIRYKSADYVRQRFFDEKYFSDLNIDKSEKNIDDLFKSSKVVVAEALQTTYLESLSLNIPTIVFTNHKSELFREDFIPYLNKLKNCKIFFDNPIEAAEHLNEYWDNIDNWWKNDKTQEIVQIFCNNYIFNNENKLSSLKNFLTI